MQFDAEHITLAARAAHSPESSDAAGYSSPGSDDTTMAPPFALPPIGDEPVAVHELHQMYALASRPLGKGGYATVFHGHIAVKVCKADVAAVALNEAGALAELGPHRNLVRLFAVQRLETGGIALVLSLAQHGSLDSLLRKDREWARRNTMTALHDVLAALAFCHSRNIVHCDVTTNNVLLAGSVGDWHMVLADFGMATRGPRFALSDEITALWFRAPESLLFATYDAVVPPGTPDIVGTPAVDVWSAGCVAMAMAGVPCTLIDRDAQTVAEQIDAVLAYARPCEAIAWREAAPYLVAHVVAQGHGHALVPDVGHRAAGHSDLCAISVRGAALIEELLVLDPARRPTAAAALIKAGECV